MVLGATLPVGTPALAPSDLALLSDGSAKGVASSIHARLSDPLLAEWQENMRRALEHVSVVKALLSTVSQSVFGDAAMQPEFSNVADPSEVVSLMRYAGTGVRVLTECLASAHTNIALARRDALLLQPKQATPVAIQAMLRNTAAPVHIAVRPPIGAQRSKRKRTILSSWRLPLHCARSPNLGV